jgi:hypothetical protein
MPSRLEMSAFPALSFPVASASGLDGPQAECDTDTGWPSLRIDVCVETNHHPGKEKAIFW